MTTFRRLQQGSNKRQRTTGPTMKSVAFPTNIEALIRSYTGISADVVKERHTILMKELSFWASLTRELFGSDNNLDLIHLLEQRSVFDEQYRNDQILFENS